MTQVITVLGSTGSIGTSTLDVLARHPDDFSVYALTAYQQVDLLLQQCAQFKPQIAVMVDEDAAKVLAQKLRAENIPTQVRSGHEALAEVASAEPVTQVMAAIVGAAGLLPTLAAAKSGKRVLLANKEALVMSGQLFMESVRKGKAELLPIDSEHNAIFQALPADFASNGWENSGIRKILLTASGGPFLGWKKAELSNVTPAQAVKHPNWSMGQKISVDSATLMNKGLELIEACWLFHVQPEQIEVVVHPESVIHSMVQYIDGSVIAQMGNPDMRTPIAYGLGWPARMESGVSNLDFFQLNQLNFEAPDHQNFPALMMAAQAFKAGGTTATVLNAANEVAVEAFLREQIPYTAISDLIDQALNVYNSRPADSLEAILEADQWARDYCCQRLQSLTQH